jgi:hypothetical protein
MPPGGVCFSKKIAISAGVRPAAVTIGRQQLKILLIGRAPSSFKYYLKVNGDRTIIFGGTEYKISSGDVFLIGRFFFTKTPSDLKGVRADIGRAPPGA